MRASHKHAFTLVELIVVVVIVGLLLALVIPTGPGGRARPRRVQCLNNLKQLALSNLVHESSHRWFPGYLDVQPTSADGRQIDISWAARLLAYVDQATLWNQIISDNEARGFDYDRPPYVEVFVCPSDPQEDPTYPALSYVANSGMPDAPAPSEKFPSDLKANGLFHDRRPGKFGPGVFEGRIRDGASRTILLSENVHRDYPPPRHDSRNTWLSPGAGADNVEQWYGMTWVYDPASPRTPSPQLFEPFNRDSLTEDEVLTPYAAEGARFARPASYHPEIFNMAMCDGSVREVRDDIDYAVYQQLMTPDGQKAALPTDPTRFLTEFMSPPLSDADY
jgi:prepilin-type N-terminal cleavage/methylation domain-containing protein